MKTNGRFYVAGHIIQKKGTSIFTSREVEMLETKNALYRKRTGKS